MKIYTCWTTFNEDIDELRNCKIGIVKNFECFLTNLPKSKLIEIKNLLKLKNIEIELIKQPSDEWDQGWSWKGFKGRK